MKQYLMIGLLLVLILISGCSSETGKPLTRTNVEKITIEKATLIISSKNVSNTPKTETDYLEIMYYLDNDIEICMGLLEETITKINNIESIGKYGSKKLKNLTQPQRLCFSELFRYFLVPVPDEFFEAHKHLVNVLNSYEELSRYYQIEIHGDTFYFSAFRNEDEIEALTEKIFLEYGLFLAGLPDDFDIKTK